MQEIVPGAVERTARPRRRRRPPGVVIAAAALLGLYGLFALLSALFEGEDGPHVAGLAVGCVLLAAAIGLVVGRRAGYWFGLACAGLTTLGALALQVLPTSQPAAGKLADLGLVVVPLVLLLLPAARREPSAPAEKDAGNTKGRRTKGGRTEGRRTEGRRTKGAAGTWATFVGMIAFGGAAATFGVAAFLGSDPGDGTGDGTGGIIVGLFGCACLFVSPSLWPGPRSGRVSGASAWVRGQRERGVGFPYAWYRPVSLVLGGACMALVCLGLLVYAPEITDQNGPVLVPRVFGLIGFLFFGLATVMGLRRGVARRWSVVLTPSAVVVVNGRSRSVTPWHAIEEVKTLDVTTEPFIGLIVDDRDAVRTGRLERALMPLNRRLGADVALPLRGLAVDPALLFDALSHYHAHPEERDELATDTGLMRVRQRALD